MKLQVKGLEQFIRVTSQEGETREAPPQAELRPIRAVSKIAKDWKRPFRILQLPNSCNS
jgi:hypothetical protein